MASCNLNVKFNLNDWEEDGIIFLGYCESDPEFYVEFVRGNLVQFGSLDQLDQLRLLTDLTDLSKTDRAGLLHKAQVAVAKHEAKLKKAEEAKRAKAAKAEEAKRAKEEAAQRDLEEAKRAMPSGAVILKSRTETAMAEAWVAEHTFGAKPRSDGEGMWIFNESEDKWDFWSRKEVLRSIQIRFTSKSDDDGGDIPYYSGVKWYGMDKGKPVPVAGSYRLYVSIANALMLQPTMEHKLAIGIRGGRLVTLDDQGSIVVKKRSPEDMVTHSYDVDYYEDETLDDVLARFSPREQKFMLTQGRHALRQLAQAGGVATLGQGCVKVGGEAPRAWLLVDSKELNDLDNVGGTGKSQWVDSHGLFRAFIPPQLISTTEFAAWGTNQFALTNMMGKRLNLMNEAGKAIPGEALELIKKAITGGTLDFQRKGQDVETGLYTAANIGAANSLPPVPQADRAFWRRMIPIVFGVKVFDTDLERKDEPCISIVKNELDALFALFMWGYRDVVANGYARNDEALQDWCDASSYLKETIKELLVPDNETPLTKLRQIGKTVSSVSKMVREQMREDGFKVPNKADVERALKQLGFKIEDCGNARVVCCRNKGEKPPRDTFTHMIDDE